ncbi:MAG: hypothetical protein SVY10_19200 [Thermodesulfobacteriota bacterium]|nr:hypothetical protein [Thermodesulfobacteriota bacterium]
MTVRVYSALLVSFISVLFLLSVSTGWAQDTKGSSGDVVKV